jgi:bifunctional UDP-N-acetylglucosamine pyrophosphorylase/glucosamine-1-phosphate N-acetyltransferase
MPLSVVILAAGQGKRMNSDLPKVLQLLAGKPLLQHVIDTARQLDPADLYVVYGHGGAQVQSAFTHERLQWVLQAEQLGTGHAVMQAMNLIPDDHTVLVLYGDVPLVSAACLGELIHNADSGALALLTVKLPDATGYGRILRRADGAVTGIVEQKDATPEQASIREANSGLLAVRAAMLREWLLGLKADNAAREYYLTDVVTAAASSQVPIRPIAVAHPFEVLGVNDRLQLARAESAYRSERAEELMIAGATLADPTRIDVRGEVTVERDVFIDVGAVFIGRVHLGSRVKVGPYCVIRDARLGSDTEVKANCVIEDAVVGDNCRIGPFARLRPGTVLRADVHVGNFVEVKNSVVGPGSKVNHLSYVGDATVGAHVNVGAGTITCNYDGVNKSATVIEDGAFIGSGTMLVAPVRIGAGATIGAGSTITQPAADGQLTLARARQITVADWRRPTKKP